MRVLLLIKKMIGEYIMYINGEEVKRLREEVDITRTQLAEMLAIDESDLRRYEEDGDWYEEDAFVLLMLGEILPEQSYLLHSEYLEMLEEIDKEYN